MKEKPIGSLAGIPIILAVGAAFAGMAWYLLSAISAASITPAGFIAALAVVVVGIFFFAGLYTLEPNQAAVLSLFGKYVGTVKDPGLRWNSPFYAKKRISQRVRNFESGRLKVNELDGSPIEIAAVIVWQVMDASEAVYNVDDYESFVHIQSEAARARWPPAIRTTSMKMTRFRCAATRPRSANNSSGIWTSASRRLVWT